VNCFICGSQSAYYFSKTYTEAPFSEHMRGIGPVDYHKCGHCGFVFSKTHADLDPTDWNRLNEQFHAYIEDPSNESRGNQPPYAEQAMMLVMLATNGLVDMDSAIDYAAGYGTLSNLLSKYHGIRLPVFDRYVQDGAEGRYVREADLGTYKTVINSAMFEHVLRREDLDAVNALVADDGALVIHTVICERVPADPDWFYLRPPVHTAFHTNKSMQILMEQWGYRSSVYCPPAKAWVLLRSAHEDIGERVESINRELQSTWFHHRAGFVDFWKGF
jgi:hypothetical protein